MVSHLFLPAPQGLASRRVPRGFGQTPQRNPRRHGGELKQQMAAFPPAPSARSDLDGVDARYVFKIRSDAGFSDDHILELRRLQVLGNDDNSTYFVLAADGGKAFAEALERYSQGDDIDGGTGELSSLYNKIDSIELYGVADRTGPGISYLREGSVVVDVTLWPSDGFEAAQERMTLLELTVGELGGEIIARSVMPRFSVARCRINAESVGSLLELYVIETARTPPVPFMDPSDWREADAETLNIQWTGSAPVGVLDDLPAVAHPVFGGHVSVTSPAMDIGRPWNPPAQHGTLVAGIVLAPELADDLRSGSAIRVRGEVKSIRVLEPTLHDANQSQFPPEVLPSQLVTASIRKLHAESGVRVFNLSFGYDRDYAASHIGEFSEMIDSLIRELDIVVVVAAGNASIRIDGSVPSGHHVLDDYPSYLDAPEHGLAQPANAALALTVGGISASDAPTERFPPQLGRRAVAPVGHSSPFSRTGPGHGRVATRMNKPDLVAPAGNVVVDDTGLVDLRDQGTGVLSTAFRSSGPLFQVAHGTSFAAPAVASIAASVLHTYPDASANLVRVLLASAASPPIGSAAAADESKRHNRYGFGIVSAPDAVDSRAQRVTMMYDGVMSVDTVAIHPVPIPRDFALPRSATRTIRIALAFDPPVRRTRQEYTTATMITDAYRAVSLEDLQERLVRQDASDPHPLFDDRRRLTKFRPPHTAHRESTLQVKDWSPRQLDTGDGDVYFVVVTHKTRTWFRERDDYQSQTYALAVSLIDESQVQLDLPLSVLQTTTVRARARTRV